MSKYLFYSDLHIRPERLADCEKVLKAVGEKALELDAVIVNGGDTFNTRGLIRTSCFDVLYKAYHDWHEAGLKQIIVVGNHDQEDRAGEIHPMRVFSEFKDWHVVDRPYMIGSLAVLPYLHKSEVKGAIESLMPGAKGLDAVVHWGIMGGMRNDKSMDMDGVPLEWLKDFRQVFSGHYHYRNEIGNVQYIGSPFQQSFSEMGQQKGLLFFDSQTREKRFIPLEGLPEFKEVQVEKGELIGRDEVKANDFVRVKVQGRPEDVQKITREWAAQQITAQAITIDRDVEQAHSVRLQIERDQINDAKNLMRKYVEFVETTLNKDKLLEIGFELIGGDYELHRQGEREGSLSEL